MHVHAYTYMHTCTYICKYMYVCVNASSKNQDLYTHTHTPLRVEQLYIRT